MKKLLTLAVLAVPFAATACERTGPEPAFNYQTDLFITEPQYWDGGWAPLPGQQVNVTLTTEADFKARCNDLGGYYRANGFLCLDIRV
jgi:hypothetical protein